MYKEKKLVENIPGGINRSFYQYFQEILFKKDLLLLRPSTDIYYKIESNFKNILFFNYLR